MFWVGLTHCSLVTSIGDIDMWVNIGSGNGLLPNGTQPLPEPMLTYHQRVLWHSPKSNFTGSVKDINFEKFTCKITSTFLRRQWVKNTSQYISHSYLCSPNGSVLVDLSHHLFSTSNRAVVPDSPQCVVGYLCTTATRGTCATLVHGVTLWNGRGMQEITVPLRPNVSFTKHPLTHWPRCGSSIRSMICQLIIPK